MDLGLEDSVSVILASSGGLGKAAASSLAREGANVIINGRSEEKLEEARKDIASIATGDVSTYQGDITDKTVPKGMVQRAISKYGRLDHLVTSAGGPPRMRFSEATDEDWYDGYELLVMPVVRSIREASPHLQDEGGAIVTITSGLTKEASPHNVLSSSVRMAVMGLQKMMSIELAPEIRTNAIMPGGHETPRVFETFDKLIEEGEIDDYDEGKALRAEDHPIGRLGKPEEFGDTVAYLCSERAGNIDGVALHHDGGKHKSTF